MKQFSCMNFDMLNSLVAKLEAHEIGWRDFGVGVLIAGYAGMDNTTFASSKTIGAACGIDGRNVRLGIGKLIKAGVCNVEHRPGRSSVIHITPTLSDAPLSEKTPGGASQASDTPTFSDAGGASQASDIQKHLQIHLQIDEQRTANAETLMQPKRKTPPKGKPKVERTDSGFNVPDTIRAAWVSAYPGIDIDGELAKAHAWCLTNPKKAGARKDLGRFLNCWLARARPVPASNWGGISQEEADRYNAQWLEIENELAREAEAESCQAV